MIDHLGAAFRTEMFKLFEQDFFELTESSLAARKWQLIWNNLNANKVGDHNKAYCFYHKGQKFSNDPKVLFAEELPIAEELIPKFETYIWDRAEMDILKAKCMSTINLLLNSVRTLEDLKAVAPKHLQQFIQEHVSESIPTPGYFSAEDIEAFKKENAAVLNHIAEYHFMTKVMNK